MHMNHLGNILDYLEARICKHSGVFLCSPYPNIFGSRELSHTPILNGKIRIHFHFCNNLCCNIWVLNGSHEGIVCGKVKFDKTVQLSGCYRSNRITVRYSQQVQFSTVEEYEYELSEKKFMAGEALGCEPPRRCADCRGCAECGFRGANMSQKEALELRMMEDNISFNDTIGKWRVKYPFLQDPRVLENNYRRVLRMMETLERRLDKLGQVEAANEVFSKIR